jgi:hypothetical protein
LTDGRTEAAGGCGARAIGTGAARGAGGARMPELVPPDLPLPNGLKKKFNHLYMTHMTRAMSTHCPSRAATGS